MGTIGDLVLIYQQERPALFARIEDICPDAKPGWYQVRLLILKAPVVEAVWILREEYINGEPFTMNGLTIRIEDVRGPHKTEYESSVSDNDSKKRGDTLSNKVISLFDSKSR